MREYSNRIAVYKTNEKLDYARPDNQKKDPLDLKLSGKSKVSEVGRVVAYKQNRLGGQIKELRDFIKQVEGERQLLKRDEAAKLKEKEDAEIKEACEAIKLKYFSNAMQPHDPNTEFQNMMAADSETTSIAARSQRSSDRRRGNSQQNGQKRLMSAFKKTGHLASRDERVKFQDTLYQSPLLSYLLALHVNIYNLFTHSNENEQIIFQGFCCGEWLL